MTILTCNLLKKKKKKQIIDGEKKTDTKTFFFFWQKLKVEKKRINRIFNRFSV